MGAQVGRRQVAACHPPLLSSSFLRLPWPNPWPTDTPPSLVEEERGEASNLTCQTLTIPRTNRFWYQLKRQHCKRSVLGMSPKTNGSLGSWREKLNTCTIETVNNNLLWSQFWCRTFRLSFFFRVLALPPSLLLQPPSSCSILEPAERETTEALAMNSSGRGATSILSSPPIIISLSRCTKKVGTLLTGGVTWLRQSIVPVWVSPPSHGLWRRSKSSAVAWTSSRLLSFPSHAQPLGSSITVTFIYSSVIISEPHLL